MQHFPTRRLSTAEPEGNLGGVAAIITSMNDSFVDIEVNRKLPNEWDGSLVC